MTIEKSNPITGFETTFLLANNRRPNLFGWIRLINGDSDAGYIYIQDEPRDGSLNSDGTYIVSAVSRTDLPHLMAVLNNQRDLKIRLVDPESADLSPSVFIESGRLQTSTLKDVPTPEEIFSPMGL